MFINFDNSEDAFFPDNETVRLLNEVEDEYQASIDFIRFIDDIDSDDLYEESTWQQLAILEVFYWRIKIYRSTSIRYLEYNQTVEWLALRFNGIIFRTH